MIEKILRGITYEVINISNIHDYGEMQYDSNLIKENDIFVALKGSRKNGHDYIEDAIERGASMVILSEIPDKIKKNITYIKVNDLRKNLGTIASNYYNWPQKKLTIIGVTGTNGKTSVVYILDKIFGRTTRIGTLNYKVGNEVIKAKNTTPESLDIIKLFNKTIEKNIKYVIMEVSSHSLESGRVDMLKFDAALFTNLSSEHMDFHRSMKNYFSSKRKLFLKLKEAKNGIFNIDDIYGKNLYSEFGGTTYSSEYLSDVSGKILDIKNGKENVSISVKGKEYLFKTTLIGKFNLYNIMGAIGLVYKFNFNIEEALMRISRIKSIPGRLELVENEKKMLVFVDYAHTPDALKNVLLTLNEVRTGKIITVFGCGGERDKEKRAQMGSIAEKLSDYVIVTSDNPREEDPKKIINDIQKGFVNYKHKIIRDRESAIQKAVRIANKEDIILIAGKGHEKYQILGDVKVYFDDVEVVKKYLQEVY